MTTWAVTWDETYPAGTNAASGIATYIEQDKIAVRERMNSLLGISNWGTSLGPPMQAYQVSFAGGANAKIQIGTTDFSFYDDTNSTQLFKIVKAGDATFYYSLTVASGGLTVTAGGLTITAGGLTVTAGDSAFKKVTVSSAQGVVARYSAGSSGTALTIDWNNGNNQVVSMTGACTFTFSNPIAGAWYSLELTQDATGSRTASWPASVKWPSASAPVLTTTASKTDILTFYYNGTNYIGFQAGFNY